MINGSIGGVGYAGSAALSALVVKPYIEAQGFDGKQFMHTVMDELKGMGVMRGDAQITAIEHRSQDFSSALSHVAQLNLGKGSSRA